MCNFFRWDIFGRHRVCDFISISFLFFLLAEVVYNVDSFVLVLRQSFNGCIHLFMDGSVSVLKRLDFSLSDLAGQARSLCDYLGPIEPVVTILPNSLHFSVSFILDNS